MKKASISVYLSLILMILSSLFLTCIEGARIQATKLKVAYAADAAITSSFAEYRKELFEKYDLLFVDVSYGGCCNDLLNLKERLKSNFAENCVPEIGKNLFSHKTLFAIDETDVLIDAVQTATDLEGEIFKEAAISYMRSKYLVAELELFQNEIKEYEDAGFFSSDIKEERTKNEELIIQTAVIQVEENAEEEVSWEPIEVDNPADKVNKTRPGVLNLVVKDINEVSKHTVSLSSYASNRENCLGTKQETEGAEDKERILDDLFFSEYILEKSGEYINPMESEFLTYGCEYIIAGKESDVENLRNVVNRIILIRETVNVAHILADSTKMQELEVLSAGLAAVITLPELQPIIKYSLVLAWGYAESVSDVKRLLKGEKVSFYKTKEEWTLSLENMLSLNLKESDGGSNNNNDENGITYQQYLRMLIYIEPTKQKVARMMNIVEMGMRSLGYKNFRLDTCVNEMKVEFIALDRSGKTYKEKKEKRY